MGDNKISLVEELKNASQQTLEDAKTRTINITQLADKQIESMDASDPLLECLEELSRLPAAPSGRIFQFETVQKTDLFIISATYKDWNGENIDVPSVRLFGNLGQDPEIVFAIDAPHNQFSTISKDVTVQTDDKLGKYEYASANGSSLTVCLQELAKWCGRLAPERVDEIAPILAKTEQDLKTSQNNQKPYQQSLKQ